MLPLQAPYARRPLIWGHRGAAGHAPENTMASFALALAQGADGIELDTVLSADGFPVVIHDDSLDRTTSGQGLVSRRSLAELKALDAGFSAQFGQTHAGECVPTLDEVLGAFGRQTLINIELKRDGSPNKALAARVVELVHAHGLAERVILSSFQSSNLRRVRALDPALPIGLLYARALGGARLLRWLSRELRPEAHHPGCTTLQPEAIDRFHAQGLRVNTWTVNEETDLRRFANAGVDGLITDYPDRAVAVRAAQAAA